MKLRTFTCAAALAVIAAWPAYADDKNDARAQCIALTNDAIQVEQMPPDQKPKVEAALVQMCTCMTDKIAGMGDDGTKVLRVLAKTTPEMAKASAADPNGDRRNAIAVLVAEYGLSEAEAGTIYDRVNPKVMAAGEECQADMMKALSGQ
jgi:hypothetical protein